MKRYISALTIAGSDPSGGAGIQADLKAFSALGVYGASAITALTVQNTVGVKYVHALPAQVVYDQIVAVMEDIKPDAVKIGMVNDAATLDAIVRALGRFKPKFIVVDPVMVSTSGCVLMQDDALKIMKEQLLPMADLVTPNLPEAYILADSLRDNDRGCQNENHVASGISQFGVTSSDDMAKNVDETANRILSLGVKALLIKGGHTEGKTKTDFLYINNVDDVKRMAFTSDSINTVNTHGTGCTLSSSIAALSARGYAIEYAVRLAKAYLTEAIKAGAGIVVGNGHGPVNHFYKTDSFKSAENKNLRSDLIIMLSEDVKNLSKLQFITHFTDKYSYFDSAMIALEGGCRWIQLRMKDADEAEVERVARLILPECRRRGAVFIIDDNVDVAKRIGSDGVHLGKNDMPVSDARNILGNGFIIGGTANTIDDIRRLALQGADYIGCGPFRFTTTKKNLAPMLGVEGYRNISSQMKNEGIMLPIVAIGGITSDVVPQIMSCGVTGIALSGSVLRAENPVDEMKKIVNILGN